MRDIKTILQLILIGLIAFFAIQCVDAKDDYDMAYFGKDAKIETTFSQFSATVSFVEKDEDIQKMWKSIQHKDDPRKNWEVRGFALVNADGRCIVVIPKINHWDERDKLAILGHEILHCLGGEHPAPIK